MHISPGVLPHLFTYMQIKKRHPPVHIFIHFRLTSNWSESNLEGFSRKCGSHSFILNPKYPFPTGYTSLVRHVSAHRLGSFLRFLFFFSHLVIGENVVCWSENVTSKTHDAAPNSGLQPLCCHLFSLSLDILLRNLQSFVTVLLI